ncbi:MAG: hypothetical protein BV457_00225 [Thermoplasmata archaeon M9B1D]|nr:MAG: hypothetical protein BV457_00225 [Thermoplasmata archaeon M9B1D]PNX52209.1 MAG: hypothetical protein BV456_00070 [Thermoplasmata archaeon M8B2D]
MTKNKIINLEKNTPHKVEKLFCINCCKSIIMVSKDYEDTSNEECPVCKQKLRKYEDLCLYDVFDILARQNEKIHEENTDILLKKNLIIVN